MLEVISIIISLVALGASFYIGVKQVKISQTQIDFQNKVELYLLTEARIYRDAKGENPDTLVPAIFIRNVGNGVVYLEKYVFNGREYPTGKNVIPPVSVYSDAVYTIELPTNGTTHVSLKLYFLDWQNQPWEMEGYADFKDRHWEISYSPCKRKGS